MLRSPATIFLCIHWWLGLKRRVYLAAGLLCGHQRLRVRPGIGHRNFHLHVLARLQAGDGLLRVHLRGRAEDDGINFGQRQRLIQFCRDMRHAVFCCDFLRLF